MTEDARASTFKRTHTRSPADTFEQLEEDSGKWKNSAGHAEEHTNFRTSAVFAVVYMLGGIVTDVLPRQVDLQQTA